MAAVGSARAPGDEVLVEMGREVGVIRACIDQFIGGIRPGEEAQVQQARVVQRVQGSLERLAALGQDAHRVLPPSLNEHMVGEKERPVAAGSDPAAAAQLYEAFGTGLDAEDTPVAQTSDVALKKREQWRRVPDAMYAAWRAVGAARAKAFPAACISPRIRKRSVSTSEAGNAVHAGAKKRSRIADDGIDAPLIPDSTAQVLATVDGKVSKLLKSSSGVKKGTPAAILLKDQDQRQMMIAPADGTVTTQHVKEGQPVKAGELLLSIDVSGLSQYVALLNRTPAIRAAVERTAMSDDAASTADRPTRFNLVVALQGVLTARLAMRVIRAPAAGRGAHKTAAGGGDANTGGSSKADAMVVDVEGGEGGDSAGGMVIEAMSMSGVTEVVQPWDASGMAVFRAINREAFSALDRLRARRLRQGAEELRCGQDVVSGLVRWLGSYRALFSSKCVYCKKILVADSCEQEAGKHTFLPPTGRDLDSGEAYHPQCCPVSTRA